MSAPYFLFPKIKMYLKYLKTPIWKKSKIFIDLLLNRHEIPLPSRQLLTLTIREK